jgi:hypothetical protein
MAKAPLIFSQMSGLAVDCRVVSLAISRQLNHTEQAPYSTFTLSALLRLRARSFAIHVSTS